MHVASLRHGLHYCEIDGRVFFLDIENDRYFCLSDRLSSACLSILENPMADVEPTALSALLDLRVLVDGAEQFDGHCSSLPAPLRSAIADQGSAFPSRWHTMQAVFSITNAKRLLRRKGLRKALDYYQVATSNAPSPPSREFDLQTICHAFDRSRLYVASLDQCVAHSMALSLFLHREGLRTNLIFGISAHPFAAHCWVQYGENVLNDSVEHARAFTPIMRV